MVEVCRRTRLRKIDPLPSIGELATRPRDATRHPTLGVQKYATRVTPGDPSPPPETRSQYFCCLELVETFFQAEVARRLDVGLLAVKGTKGSKTPGALLIMNSNAIHLYQEAISLNAKVDPGKLLGNPIARIPIKFGEDWQPKKGFVAYDMSKPVQHPDGTERVCYEELRYEGEPLNARNVHNLRPGSRVSGIVSLGTVCYSTMGISLPVGLECLYVNPPPPEQTTFADLFDGF